MVYLRKTQGTFITLPNNEIYGTLKKEREGFDIQSPIIMKEIKKLIHGSLSSRTIISFLADYIKLKSSVNVLSILLSTLTRVSNVSIISCLIC